MVGGTSRKRIGFEFVPMHEVSLSSKYGINEVFNVNVTVDQGTGWVEVWQHDVPIGDTRSRYSFPIDSGVPVRFVGFVGTNEQFDKYCDDNGVCSGSNPFTVTFNVPGNIHAYFIPIPTTTDVTIYLRDSETQMPLLGTVELGFEMQDTDPTGKAVFHNKAYGDYTVRGSAPGYNSKEENITVSPDNNVFNIYLIPISTPTPTPSQTPSPIPSPTPSQSPSPTPAPSPTPSQTPFPTPTPSQTPSPTGTPTPIPTIPPIPTVAPGKCPTDPIGCLFCSVFKIPLPPGYPFPVSDNCQSNITFPVPFITPSTPQPTTIQPTGLQFFLGSILKRR